ncbi:MAG: DUF2145 domain-containing protein [Telluria sp.]
MKRFLLLLLVACSVGTAHGGQACEEKPFGVAAFASGMKLAENTLAALEASEAQVALIARVGQDLSRQGLRYSHMAYAWRDHPKGRWLVVHELNDCGTAQSALYDEGLGNFFFDVFAHEAAIVIPSPYSQARIAAMLASPVPRRLHTPRYNMLAYAFSTQYQNSNQWVLETYAASASEFVIGDRAKAQQWLKLAGYAPITVHVPAAQRLGARLFRANVEFDDHPFGRRAAGQIDTVTVESVMRFVKQVDPGAREILVR